MTGLQPKYNIPSLAQFYLCFRHRSTIIKEPANNNNDKCHDASRKIYRVQMPVIAASASDF